MDDQSSQEPLTYTDRVRQVASCATTREYRISYSPSLVIVYRIYEEDSKRVIEETVKCRWPTLRRHVSLPGEQLLKVLRREQGIPERDARTFPEEVHPSIGWQLPTFLRLIAYNTVPLWRVRWKYPLQSD